MVSGSLGKDTRKMECIMLVLKGVFGAFVMLARLVYVGVYAMWRFVF